MKVLKLAINKIVKISLQIDIGLMLFGLNVILEILIVHPTYPAVLVIRHRNLKNTIILHQADVTPT